MSTEERDFIAIGLGPFNLGLACLTEPIDDLDGVFLERKEEVDWHPGMLLPGTTMQVPFMADLVTMADPTSPYSFLNYLKQEERLYPFYIRESFFPLRSEYQTYLKWAASRLSNLRFRHDVHRVTHADGLYTVHADTPEGERTYRAPRLVLGTGPAPYVPESFAPVADKVVHSGDYLHRRAEIQEGRSVTVVGSGQSAAEIYRDLLGDAVDGGYTVDWVTRSPRFFPMEYTKLTLELTSPEYVDYFHALPGSERDRLNRDQKSLYKGINGELIDEIYELLYQLDHDHGSVPTRLWTNSEVTATAAGPAGAKLSVRHVEQERDFALDTEHIVACTGYSYAIPGFLDPVRDRFRIDERGRFEAHRDYTVDADRSVFVQNAELATHGFVSPDLGMAAYRNAHLVRTMTGKEHYPIERRIAFQEFGTGENR
ncbi:lysine N(6)-hydroxylase/L-ornithine N(5)-oxygenase family protein [Salininema proteolyticum]|uniref:L-lysine N6-monooxygenase MbtG n=1 Tax=Salininema proteolyticum TaxID=1607685 RepID=A0ABV8U4Y5_9ACTN